MVDNIEGEYMNFEFELYKDIDVLNNIIFNTQKNSKIKKLSNHSFLSDLDEKEYEYIYISNNNLLPKTSINNLLSIDSKYIYKICLEGITDIKEVLFFTMNYCDNEKISVESININKYIEIYPNERANNIRFAIRVLGSGKLDIKNIKIYRKTNVNLMKDEELKKINLNEKKYKEDLNVAVICDEFTMNCFKYEFKTIKITPDSWKLDLINNKPDFLFVESAWNGNNGAWYKKIASRDKNSLLALKELTSWCKDNNIPTVFWNKEDPVHFDVFKLASKNFDYIFTTDENCIEKYKKILNHDNVYSLPFAAQPKIHNPIKISNERINKACFAGTYYTGKFEERQNDTKNILLAALKTTGLEIYDRQYFDKNTSYKYPSEYQPYIKGGLNVDELDIVNKGYKIMLNVNSVKNSNTMFSRRVFEGLASLTPIVSSYSLGIKNMFGELVFSSDNILELEKEMKNLQDELYYNQKAIKGMRFCLNNHTYEDRLKYILSKIGLEIKEKSKKISIISVINKEEDINKSLQIFDKQTYKDKVLILIFMYEDLFNKYNTKISKDAKIILYSPEIKVKDICNTDYVGVINSNNYYGKFYIEDLINATKYTNAEFIGKKSYFKVKNSIFSKNVKDIFIENNYVEFEYVDFLDIDKCIINTDIIKKNKLLELINHIVNNDLDLFKYGYRYFSIDKYNLVENLYDIDENRRKIIEI